MSRKGVFVDTALVILAAGQGTRMKSSRPKVLHELAGLPMIGHVVRAGEALSPNRIVVVHMPGDDGDAVAAAARSAMDNPALLKTAVQETAQGTGHAVMAARAALTGFSGLVIVAFGDTPLLRPESFTPLVEAAEAGAKLVFMGFETATPGGYGRMVQGPDGALDRIVEAKDANPEELAITLVNGGIMAADAALLMPLLDRLSPENAQGEYYLTDLPKLAAEDGVATHIAVGLEEDVLGINSRSQLAEAESLMQARLRLAAMDNGATLIDPASTFLSWDTVLGRDVWVGPNCWFGPGVTVGDDVTINPMSHLEGATVGNGASVGPYGRLRPGADLGEGSKVGNFVEMKKATLGKGAKVNHLTYIGDASIGEGSNIGAGTITCNYDGYDKFKTEIGARAFVGSNSTLVAPVVIEDDAFTAAGSTITKRVEAGSLAVGRASQSAIAGWVARFRKKKAKK